MHGNEEWSDNDNYHFIPSSLLSILSVCFIPSVGLLSRDTVYNCKINIKRYSYKNTWSTSSWTMTLVAKHMTPMTVSARHAQDTPKTGTVVGVWNNESIPVTRLYACQPELRTHVTEVSWVWRLTRPRQDQNQGSASKNRVTNATWILIPRFKMVWNNFLPARHTSLQKRPIILMTNFAGCQELLQVHSGLSTGHGSHLSNPYPLISLVCSDLIRWDVITAGNTAE